MLKKWIVGLLSLCINCAVYSQSNLQQSVLNFTQRSDSLVHQSAAEKIYIQFDKPGYVSRDTI